MRLQKLCHQFHAEERKRVKQFIDWLLAQRVALEGTSAFRSSYLLCLAFLFAGTEDVEVSQ